MVTRGSGKRGFATYFSDVLRQELVETHGGIYVDTDTWPVRKFDDRLLSLKHFNAIAHPDNREYFFFGAEAGTNSWFDSYDENNYFEKDMYDALDYSYNTYLSFDRQKYL